MANPQIREDMISSAVDFLLDKSVADSSLAKKIEFLQSKGLSEPEVKEAIRRAQISDTTGTSKQNSNPVGVVQNGSNVPPPPAKDYANNYPLYYSNAPPLSAERDWKDYLIMGAATAGLMYGAYKVVRNYVIPKVFPSSKSDLELEKNAVDQEFKRITSLLDKFDADQKDFYKKQNEKSAKIDQTMVEVDKIINKTNEKNLQNEETLKFLKLQVDNIKTSLMKSVESQKQTIGSELSSLEKQIDELKVQLKELSSGDHPTGADFFKKSTSTLNSPLSTSASVNSSKSSQPSTANASSTDLSHLKIPPASSIPSVKDILTNSNTPKNIHDLKGTSSSNSTDVEIPAWQKTVNNQNDDKADSSIPSWQVQAST